MWQPDIHSWRTFDALDRRSDEELRKLQETLERELRSNETPAYLEKSEMVKTELVRRSDERAGRSPAQLRARAVVALERIAKEIEEIRRKLPKDRSEDLLNELQQIRGALDGLEHIANEITEVGEKLPEDRSEDLLNELQRISSTLDERRVR